MSLRENFIVHETKMKFDYLHRLAVISPTTNVILDPKKYQNRMFVPMMDNWLALI